MNNQWKSKLVIRQAITWMACMVLITIGLTVAENVYDEVRYGMACTIVATTMLTFTGLAVGLLQSSVNQIPTDNSEAN